MKKIFDLITICFVIFVSAQQKPIAKSYQFSQTYNVKIYKVTDGDTFKAKDSINNIYTVRMANIDAPETTQAYGLYSKAYLDNFIGYKTVKLKCLPNRDLYKRYVCNVYFKNIFVNENLIITGNAWHYNEYNKDLISIEKMNSLQNAAQINKLGLWSNENKKPLEPWTYRKQRKIQKIN